MTITVTLTPPNARPARWRAIVAAPLDLERLTIRVETALLDAPPGADLDALICGAIEAETKEVA